MLLGAVGVQELAGQIDDESAVPGHAQSCFFSDRRDNGGFEVFARSIFAEFLRILLCDDYRHALLGFGNRQLGAVKALVFLRNLGKIDEQSVSQLADCDRYAARAEVVAALDQARNLLIAEETLNLSLLGGISLLNLSAAGRQRFGGMSLR